MIQQKEVKADLDQQMAAKKFLNNYLPEYISDSLPWFERDGLMTYIDKLKYDSFVKELDSHFGNMQIINFDIIHKQARGIEISDNELRKYKTTDNSRLGNYPSRKKSQIFSLAFRCPRKDIYLDNVYL